MHRHLIERWFDTTAFGIALGLSGAVVLPVLALGVMVTVIGGSFMIAEPSAVELGHVVFALLAVGGALGFVGYVRAHFGIKDPCRHNVTATLLFLTAGVLAALSVAVVVLVRIPILIGHGVLLGLFFAVSLGRARFCARPVPPEPVEDSCSSHTLSAPGEISGRRELDLRPPGAADAARCHSSTPCC